jgi:hypothetical protein
MNSTDAFMDGLTAGIYSEPSIMDKLAAYHEDQGDFDPGQDQSDLFVDSICATLNKIAMDEDSSDKKEEKGKEMPAFMKKKVEERKDGKSTKKEEKDDSKDSDESGDMDKAASMQAKFTSDPLSSFKAKVSQ